MIDVLDIKARVKKGNLRFLINNGKVYCEDIITSEVVCLSLETPELSASRKDDKTWREDSQMVSRKVIKFDKGGKEVYFKGICAGHQGKFDGEIRVTSTLEDAAKYENDGMITAQLLSVKYSLNKNPSLSNPRIVTIFLS